MTPYRLYLAYGGLRPDQGPSATFNDSELFVEAFNLHPALRRYATPKHDVLVWGTPIVQGRISDDQLLNNLESAPSIYQFAKGLNGAFLVVLFSRRERRLTIINDRFANFPIYWRCKNRVLEACTSFKELFDSQAAVRNVAAEAIFEFIYFQRLYGCKTFDEDITFLDSASVLEFSAGESAPLIKKYWMPEFQTSSLSEDEFSEALARQIRYSMDAYTSDGKRYGLMLSGGLDARALLAAASKSLICFTNCPTRNNEYFVAKELAEIKGSRHIFLPRPERFLDSTVDQSVYLDGMKIHWETQFANYESEIAGEVDAVFQGLALDIFFCGHYLPKQPIRILGRRSLLFKLDAIPQDLCRSFYQNVSYRLKTSDPYRIIRPEWRSHLSDALVGSLQPIMQIARDLGADPYQTWEYMHFHNFSRHYSFLMASSLRTYIDTRVPALENGLFDLAFAMPTRYKTNWRVYQNALANLDWRLMQVRNANTNIRASVPLWGQTLLSWSRGIHNRSLGRLFPPLRLRSMPSGADRSWPEPRQSIEVNPWIRSEVLALPQSERLESIPFIDLSSVRTLVEDHIEGKGDHSFLLNLLLTVDRALVRQERYVGQ